MLEQNKQEKAESSTLAAPCETKLEPGYGACSASGCNCQSYGGSGNTCSNCGHNYQTHW